MASGWHEQLWKKLMVEVVAAPGSPVGHCSHPKGKQDWRNSAVHLDHGISAGKCGDFAHFFLSFFFFFLPFFSS